MRTPQFSGCIHFYRDAGAVHDYRVCVGRFVSPRIRMIRRMGMRERCWRWMGAA